MAMRTGRLRKELADLEKESPEGIQIVTKSTADAGKFSASISGPEGTAYTGGNFVLEIVCGPAYPLRPPSVRFRTPVYHPNVARGDGAICLDMLKPAPAGTWSAARCGVRVMLLSIRELLRTPNTKDPLETAIAQQLDDDPDAFHQSAVQYTQSHARAEAGQTAHLPPGAGAAAVAAATQTGPMGRLTIGGTKRQRDSPANEA